MPDDTSTDQQAAAVHRAKRQREQGKAQAGRGPPSFRNLTADALIALAETTTALNVSASGALDEAWHALFGELLILNDGTISATRPSEPERCETQPADGSIIHLPQVLLRIGMSPSRYRMRTDGRFPVAIQLSERRICWRAGDVKAWIEERPRPRIFRRRPRSGAMERVRPKKS
jgi:predicted DNA-binding transcriptional regulator AlpA